MTPIDRYLVVRAASIYIVVVATIGAWAWRRPGARAAAGALLASCWNLPIVLALNLVAEHAGWWSFHARGGLLLGAPVDLTLAWIWLWGAIPAIAFPSLPLGIVVAVALGVDLVAMPAAAPVIALGPRWLAGEAVGLACALVPAQLLARWTNDDRRLAARAALQVAAFAGLTLFVIPAIAIDVTGGHWMNPAARPAWHISLLAQALALPALVGLTAVQEFATRGGGTPVPFDPPRRLVTSGIYAYVGNPMQLSAVVLLIVLGAILHNLWVSAAGLLGHVYSAGLAWWDEDQDLRQRFGDAWTEYRRGVRRWIPRIRPWQPRGRPPARLFVSETCDMCRGVARWFERRGVRGLAIVPAESHASGALRRITYETADASDAAWGVDAVARALEHIHLGWAMLGFLLRLPLIRQAAQLLADASGAGPRTIPSSVCPHVIEQSDRHAARTP